MAGKVGGIRSAPTSEGPVDGGVRLMWRMCGEQQQTGRSKQWQQVKASTPSVETSDKERRIFG